MWFIPIILANSEGEIGRIAVQGCPRQKKFVRHHLIGKKLDMLECT
jgi:hypothetical protein